MRMAASARRRRSSNACRPATRYWSVRCPTVRRVRKVDTSTAHFLGQFPASESTRDLYALHLRQYVGWCQDENAPVLEATPGQIYAYQEHMRSQGLKESTIDNKTAALRAYYRWLVTLDAISADPCAHIRRKPRTPVSRRYLSADDIRRLLDASLTDKNWALIALVTFNSMRITELISCDIENLDKRHDEVRLSFTPYRQDRLPYTVVAPEVLSRLEVSLAGRKTGPLFLNTKNVRMNRGNVTHIVKEASKRAGFEPLVSPQILYYTLLGLAMEHGFSYLSVLKAAGVVHPTNARRWLHHTERLSALNAPTRLAQLVLASPDDPLVLLTHAEALLSDTDAPAAFAVASAGAVLEGHLRDLSAKHNVPIPVDERKQTIYGFASRLAQRRLLRPADMKTFERVGLIRNDAAHGRFDRLTPDLATETLSQVRVLLRRYPLDPPETG